MSETWLHGALGLPPDETPFPWQLDVVAKFMRGEIEGVADIPTGLGKTAVMAAWLVALARGAKVPRRLIYVVDRRAVVDQATQFAMELREFVAKTPELKAALGLEGSLPISTLRGQFVDNREWLEDPSCPAIVVGTVDMVGSRLLFGGYGVSRKMRPYHAGFLGVDSLLVLDEAHLVPPFERLIEAIESNREVQPDRSVETNTPAIKLLSLSATGRSTRRTTIELTKEDFDNKVVQRRLDAIKRLKVIELGEDALHDALVREARALLGTSNRVIVFCHSRETAEKVHQQISKQLDHIELLVGERRVHERERARERLTEHGFLAGKAKLDHPAVLVATAAGEVGVDLDADHMVCDLVAWERMVQRLGRVNRRGSGAAEVVVVVEPANSKTLEALNKEVEDRNDAESALVARHELHAATRVVLERLNGDACPRGILALRRRAREDKDLKSSLEQATTPAPLRPELVRPVVDAWSMTSLRHDPSRPSLTPWLRGWVDDELQTSIVWRVHLPDGKRIATEQEGFFEAAPPRLEEILEAPTYRVVNWLTDRAHRIRVQADHTRTIRDDELAATVLTSSGEIARNYLLKDLDLEAIENAGSKKRKQEDLSRELAEATVVVDSRIAGLSDPGLLNEAVETPSPTADVESWNGVDFRVQRVTADPDNWNESFRYVLTTDSNGEPAEWLTVEDASTEEQRSIASHWQFLEDHQTWALEQAVRIAARLGLPADLARAVSIATRLHDEGKRANRWQRAFRADRTPDYDRSRAYAKTRGPVNVALLDGYRHELGSLPYAERDPEVAALPEPWRDLVLHLIAAHHGHARPTISERGCDDALPARVRERTRDVARRFLRLQEHWGPWVLAWLESLVRSADQIASRKNDERKDR